MTDEQHNSSNNATPYDSLSPDIILDSIESLGFQVSGHLTALNSYENRVYMVGIEEEADIVAKFYRPNRWSDQQILEEHQFLTDLEEDDLAVIAPISVDGKSLFHYEGYGIALFPKRAGHPLELDNAQQLEQIGRSLGRIHATGANKPFQHRNTLSPIQFGWNARKTVLESGFLPFEMESAYFSTTELLIEEIQKLWQPDQYKQQRIHGDFHPGNILYRDQTPWILDFDDCVTGPVIQDIWMLLSGDQEQQQLQLNQVIKGYRMFADLDIAELRLIESCRSLRILNYAAWLAARWEDPAFPMAFPWFEQNRFWSDHVLQLKEQLAIISHNDQHFKLKLI